MTYKRMVLIDSTWEKFEMKKSLDMHNSHSINMNNDKLSLQINALHFISSVFDNP